MVPRQSGLTQTEALGDSSRCRPSVVVAGGAVGSDIGAMGVDV
jgi:hypothetical protein